LRGHQRAPDSFLTQLAQNEAAGAEARLAAYEVQARFALADIYDRAVSGAPAPHRLRPERPVAMPLAGASTP
jgi:hypothetical protein